MTPYRIDTRKQYPTNLPQVIIPGTKELMQSEDFVYLGGVLSHDLSCDKDVSRKGKVKVKVGFLHSATYTANQNSALHNLRKWQLIGNVSK